MARSRERDYPRATMPGNRAISSRISQAATLTLLGAALAACTTGQPSDRDFAGRMTLLLQAVYTETAEVHIDPPDLAAFTLAGLRGLKGLDPSIRVDITDHVVTVQADGEAIVETDLPDIETSPADWGRFASEIVVTAHTEATLLETAAEADVQEHFIDSALRTLDRYSRYANPVDAADLKAERDGFGGIGVDLESHPEGARIDRVELGKPADEAGLQSGDRIVEIDGTTLAGLSLAKIQRRLRGPIDASVQLTIVRDGVPDPLAVTVGRTRIVPNTVFYKPVGQHALIRVSSFNQRTSKRMAEALGQARAELGASLSGLIIDLRGNLGGRLDQAVDTADLFLDAGLISRADGRHPESHQVFEAEPGDIAEGVPMVVLINGASASSAEILASALQDHGRAVIVGMSSFGKGSIQTIADLPNKGELYLTWARFVAPSGYPLQRMGVMPTICTSGAADAVKTLEDALGDGPESGTALLAQRRNADGSVEDVSRAVLRLCPWQPHASGDIDLAVAELLLGSPALHRTALSIGRSGQTGS